MEAIGRGGFGVVYRGLNIETGLTVAIKRVVIAGTPKDELENIEVCYALINDIFVQMLNPSSSSSSIWLLSMMNRVKFVYYKI
jgi:serine/threonine protein kinase